MRTNDGNVGKFHQYKFIFIIVTIPTGALGGLFSFIFIDDSKIIPFNNTFIDSGLYLIQTGNLFIRGTMEHIDTEWNSSRSQE